MIIKFHWIYLEGVYGPLMIFMLL